ncbi:MAG: flippase-like domain-containing protein [Candidatus Thorarchaeota archaeon]|nr:flippase-like domain-containing protein [Candidatus Thorarchaeota archaeon]
MTTDGSNKTEEQESFISTSKLVAFVVVGVLVYLLIGFYANFDLVLEALLSIPWWWVLPVMMAMSFANYAIRFVKWQYYLGLIDVNLPIKESFSIFLAGFTLTATPGKIGEAIKGYFCNEMDGTPIAKTVPVVISERITDMLAMIALAMGGFILAFNIGNQLFLLAGVGVLAIIGALVLNSETFYSKILRKLTSVGPLKRYQDSCDLIEDTLMKTLAPKPLILSSLVSIPGWFMECMELWLLLGLFTGMGLPSLTGNSLILLASATFIHAGASTVGAVLIFLPGGLGGYEAFAIGMMTTLMVLPIAIASAATMLVRFVTLWFSVMVGFVAMAIVTRMTGD